MLFFTLILVCLFIFLLGPYLLKLGARLLKVPVPSFKKALWVHLLIVAASFLLLLLTGLLSVNTSSIGGMLLLFVLGSIIEILVILWRMKAPLTKAIGIFFVFFAGSIIFTLLVTTFLVRSFLLPAGAVSMSPALLPGDHVLVNKTAFCFSQPARGHIITYCSPENKNIYHVKRIIALPGETVEIKDNKVFINGNPLDEAYLKMNKDHSAASFGFFGPLTVPGDAFFVLGDNRANSKDSRHYGCVADNLVTGLVSSIYWSTNYEDGSFRWGRIGSIPRGQ